jgi:hypothetical protein
MVICKHCSEEMHHRAAHGNLDRCKTVRWPLTGWEKRCVAVAERVQGQRTPSTLHCVLKGVPA